MRKTTIATLLAAGLASLAATSAFESSAHACGGCFGPPGPPTQVSAHRMAFAVSAKRTILWDQIQYVGDPSSFGWVLPIRSGVDVGVSSDELFNRLEGQTQLQVLQPPPPECPPPEKRCMTTCYGGGADDSPSPGGFGAADASSASDTGVTVWDSGIVGPYEATQLSATDGTALRTWLKDHGYVIPDAISPVIDTYIGEGFGFLAIKLVPTAGTSKMVPIRIAFDGASPTLPLRMVAAGTGDNVGIKLFVLGEGRWETKAPFDAAEIATADLVWNWAAMGSNVGPLENDIISAHAGKVFIAETSDDYAVSAIFGGLPAGTTTSEAGTVFSADTDSSEIYKAFPSRTSLTVTRLFGQLPHAALGTDLDLQASSGGKLAHARVAPKGINYSCPTVSYEYCPGITPTCDGTPGGVGTNPFGTSSNGSGGGGGGCTTADVTATSKNGTKGTTYVWLGLAGLALAGFGVARGRRARR